MYICTYLLITILVTSYKIKLKMQFKKMQPKQKQLSLLE